MFPFASYVSRGQSKPRLIFSRINGPIVTYFEIAVEFKSRTMLQSRYIALAILRTEKFKISDA